MIRFTQNISIITGRLAQDPMVNETSKGFAGNFTVVTDEGYLDKATNLRVDKPEFHRVIVFNKDAQYMRDNVKKGDYVTVMGRRQTRKWTDKKGVIQYTGEILADIITPISQSLRHKEQKEQKEQKTSNDGT